MGGSKFFPDLVIPSDLEDFKVARQKVGLQSEVSSILGMYGQTILSNIERGVASLDSRNHSLVMLLAQMHPHYRLKAKDNAESIDQFIVSMFEKDRAKMTKEEIDDSLSKFSYQLIEARAMNNLSKVRLAKLLRCSDATVRNYENCVGTASDRFYTVFLLMFDKHPYFTLEKIK